MKINDITDKIDASYNTIKKFVEKNKDYYEKKNNIIHITKEGFIALEEKYGVRTEVMSENNIDFYRAQVKFLSDQLEETKKYNQTFVNMLEMKDQETEAKESEIIEKQKEFEEQQKIIKGLENQLHQQELEKQEIKHELNLEKNKSLFQKIFRKK